MAQKSGEIPLISCKKRKRNRIQKNSCCNFFPGYAIILLLMLGLPKEVTYMKEAIHPKYEETTITCACGEVIHTRSTKKDIHVEICSKCHPFFTGKQKLVDTGGRVDRFKRRFGMADEKIRIVIRLRTAPTGAVLFSLSVWKGIVHGTGRIG